MRRSLRHQSQIEVTGETPIIEFNVPRLQMLQLLAGQSHFAHRAGFQPGIPTGPIEHIIDHRQARLRIAGARRPVLIGGAFPAKGSSQCLAFGQTHQGTVDAHQSVSAPAPDGMLRAIDRGQDAVAIQFAEGAVFELGPRMRHRPAGDRLKELALGQTHPETRADGVGST